MRACITFLLLFLVAAVAAGCVIDRDPVLIGGEAGPVYDGGTDDGGSCNPGDYPCPPYGNRNCDVIENHRFVPANAAARALADNDGFFYMRSLFADEQITAAMLYGTAGWCTACVAESRALNDVYARYGDINGTGNRAEFVAVVFQDDVGNPATAAYAEEYANYYGFDFPTVADTAEDILYYFDATSTPANIVIDATTMQIHDIIQGFAQPTIESKLRTLDGTAECTR